MTRTAQGRDTFLSREEIAKTALRLFDTDTRPLSVRRLGDALGVRSGAIYRYFESERQIIDAALTLVYEEAVTDVLREFAARSGEPEDPADRLAIAAVALRRAFARHYRIAPHLATAPEPTPNFAILMSILGAWMEELGLTGERAAMGLAAFGNYVYGGIIISAVRQMQTDLVAETRPPLSTTEIRPDPNHRPTSETRAALDHLIGVQTYTDEEKYFIGGLQLVLDGIKGAR